LICIILPKFVMLYKKPFILSCNKWYVLQYTTDTNVCGNTQYTSLEVHHSDFLGMTHYPVFHKHLLFPIYFIFDYKFH